VKKQLSRSLRSLLRRRCAPPHAGFNSCSNLLWCVVKVFCTLFFIASLAGSADVVIKKIDRLSSKIDGLGSKMDLVYEIASAPHVKELFVASFSLRPLELPHGDLFTKVRDATVWAQFVEVMRSKADFWAVADLLDPPKYQLSKLDNKDSIEFNLIMSAHVEGLKQIESPPTSPATSSASSSSAFSSPTKKQKTESKSEPPTRNCICVVEASTSPLCTKPTQVAPDTLKRITQVERKTHGALYNFLAKLLQLEQQLIFMKARYKIETRQLRAALMSISLREVHSDDLPEILDSLFLDDRIQRGLLNLHTMFKLGDFLLIGL
jgi:hypothetical protein